MENPSPTEEGRGQESTGAGPSGTRDDDDSPIPVQGDNISNPPHGYRNVRQRLDSQNPADTTSDDGSPSIESARIGTPSTSPSPSSPAFQQDEVYPRGFPLHDQARGNRPTIPPVIRPHPRRGGRTASISQLLGVQNPPGGGRGRGSWRVPRQTADAVPGLAVRHTAEVLPQIPESEPESESEPEPQPIPIPIPPRVLRRVGPVGGKCPVCGRYLVYPVPGQDLQPGVLPTTASLPCGHVFHADCLQMITPEGSSNTPIPCPACPRDSDDDDRPRDSDSDDD